MEIINQLYEMTAFQSFIDSPGTLLMLAIGFFVLYLGIKKAYEPLLLVPIGFGIILANALGGGMSVVVNDQIEHLTLIQIAKEYGIMNLLYYSLIKTGLLPPIIFMGVGAMTDFGPMLRNLRLTFFGGAAQIGIFSVLMAALYLEFTPKEAASLGIIGGADGPTAIYTTIILAPHLLGPIAIAAYSYMALVPVIIPFVVRLTTNKKELMINMKEQDKLYPAKTKIKNIKRAKIIFPIVVGAIVSVAVPSSVPLVGMLLFGNLIKEVGSLTERLHKVASGGIMNAATIFLGLLVGATMTVESFLNYKTLLIILGGFIAFSISIAGGIYAAKIYNVFAKKKINPLIGATGLSAVPMASRVANEISLKHDPHNHILHYAMASNIAGVIGSAVAAGVLISILR
ncbi:MAG: sodium ion-translocating decarboxylase subunit beta [Cyclobacteriaceae bacterium]|nr:sodium ion-translocating decarboxylase subunit beta [Cyclobacteriaceae bacterium]